MVKGFALCYTVEEEEYGMEWSPLQRARQNPGQSIVIAARPGVMRNALVAFLNAIPQVAILAVVDTCSTALDTVRRESPAVLVVDVDLSADAVTDLVHCIAGEMPGVTIVALVGTMLQQRMLQTAGAHFALLKGYLNDQLRQAVLPAASTIGSSTTTAPRSGRSTSSDPRF